MGASLDHAVWFHRPVDPSEWHLYDFTCHTLNGGARHHLRQPVLHRRRPRGHRRPGGPAEGAEGARSGVTPTGTRSTVALPADPLGDDVTYPGAHAATSPDKPAVVMAGTGEMVTYGELDERSIRLARLWREAGLDAGDHVALLADNHPRYFEVFWAALRSGLYITTINRYLTADEAATSSTTAGPGRSWPATPSPTWPGTSPAHAPGCDVLLMCGRHRRRASRSYEDAIAAFPTEPLEHEPRGATMLYCSGTTGRPKGIMRPLDDVTVDDPTACPGLLTMLFGFDGDTVYLSPAPLYHAAPLAFTTGVQALGGTVVVHGALRRRRRAAVDRAVPGHPQPVGADDVRPHAEAPGRGAASVTTCRRLRVAMHAAAPCPVEVKRQMIEWWGPILHRVLRRHRGQRHHCHRLGRLAGAPRLGRPVDPSARSTSATRRRRAAHRRGRHHLLRAARDAVRVPQRPRARRRTPSTPSTPTGRRSATSATSTTTATSTSPTARRS